MISYVSQFSVVKDADLLTFLNGANAQIKVEKYFLHSSHLFLRAELKCGRAKPSENTKHLIRSSWDDTQTSSLHRRASFVAMKQLKRDQLDFSLTTFPCSPLRC